MWLVEYGKIIVQRVWHPVQEPMVELFMSIFFFTDLIEAIHLLHTLPVLSKGKMMEWLRKKSYFPVTFLSHCACVCINSLTVALQTSGAVTESKSCNIYMLAQSNRLTLSTVFLHEIFFINIQVKPLKTASHAALALSRVQSPVRGKMLGIKPDRPEKIGTHAHTYGST